MANWRDVTLAETVELTAGYAFQSSRFTDQAGDVPLVKGENVGQGRVLWEISKRWPHSEYKEVERFKLKPGDVVVAMDRPWVPAGLKWAYIRRDDPDALLVQRVARLRSRSADLDQEFLRFLIGSPFFENYVRPITTGVNVPHISGKQILDFRFKLPSLPEQRRIAGILSAYDDLIENNLRRIRILEEMARALYREWFLDFRFPGHEKSGMVNSQMGIIPKGWEVKKLGEILELNYGKALKKDDRRDGDFPVYGSSGVVGTHDVSLVKGPGIIVGRKGNVGSVFWSEKDFFVIDTAYFVSSILPLRFLFYLLPTLNFINSDAAVPGLSRNQARALEILVPPGALLTEFCRLADKFEQSATNLRLQNENLRQTQNMLLPKLLSGDVTNG